MRNRQQMLKIRKGRVSATTLSLSIQITCNFNYFFNKMISLRIAPARCSTQLRKYCSGSGTKINKEIGMKDGGGPKLQAEVKASEKELSATVEATLNEKSSKIKAGITPRGFFTKWKLMLEDRFIKVSYGEGDVYHHSLAEKLEKKAKIIMSLKPEVTSDRNGMHYRIPFPGLNPETTVFERFGIFIKVVDDSKDGTVVATFQLPQPLDQFNPDEFEIKWNNGVVTFSVKRYKRKVVAYGKKEGKDEKVIMNE